MIDKQVLMLLWLLVKIVRALCLLLQAAFTENRPAQLSLARTDVNIAEAEALLDTIAKQSGHRLHLP